MPYISRNLIIAKTKADHRIKLTDEQKMEIRQLALREGLSQRQLAKRFQVSRRTITFILDPSKLVQNRKARLARGGWKQYYDTAKNASYIKKHRRHKQDVYLKLKENNLLDKD